MSARSTIARAHRRRLVGAIAIAALALTLGAPGSARADPPTPKKMEKIALWRNADGPLLRGAVIYQRRVYPEIDGTDMGPGPLGPPFAQDDLEKLSALGANVVVISHPGLFSEKPPFALDRAVEANLDRLLQRIWKADMFAVIALRTGPGRSEFTFFANEAGTWFSKDKLNDSMWGDAKAQDAWVAMWRSIAERYRDHPAVVGYELMVEPNSNAVGKNALTDNPQVWDPAEFERRFGGSLYDWNQLYPRIVRAIRAVDPHTPILVGGNGYSAVNFLDQLKPVADSRTIYEIHTYEPRKYTHQSPKDHLTYPGEVDVDWDDKPDRFDGDFLKQLYAPAEAFRARTGRDLAVTELGAMRWAPDMADYMRDETALLEARGIPYTVFQWAPIGPPYIPPVTSFNFRLGPVVDNMRTPVDTSPYIELLKQRWAKNHYRPSNVRFPATRD